MGIEPLSKKGRPRMLYGTVVAHVTAIGTVIVKVDGQNYTTNFMQDRVLPEEEAKLLESLRGI